jgi:SAM-dependent methyltransferase
MSDICGWDIATWSHAVRFWEERTDFRGRCLELGARDGGLSLWLADKGCEVVCSDVWGADRGASLHRRFGVTVTYQNIDAQAIPFDGGSFDIVVFKSMLGALVSHDRQRTAVSEMHRVLKPGGVLLFAENATATRLHRLLRQKHRAWGTAWRYISIEEIGRFLSVFSSVEIRTRGLLALAGVTERQRKILAAVDCVIDRVCPASWKYVVFGVARK